jgi:mRNA interferase HigB
MPVNVISRRKLVAFWEEHPDARDQLAGWFKVARKAKWGEWADVQRVYPKASYYRRCLVFNVCGNKYRLAVRRSQNWKTLYVVAVMTHADYDRGVWKRSCNGR